MAKAPKTEETVETAADPIYEQGASAAEAGLDASACPYGEGELAARRLARYEGA